MIFYIQKDCKETTHLIFDEQCIPIFIIEKVCFSNEDPSSSRIKNKNRCNTSFIFREEAVDNNLFRGSPIILTLEFKSGARIILHTLSGFMVIFSVSSKLSYQADLNFSFSHASDPHHAHLFSIYSLSLSVLLFNLHPFWLNLISCLHEVYRVLDWSL